MSGRSYSFFMLASICNIIVHCKIARSAEAVRLDHNCVWCHNNSKLKLYSQLTGVSLADDMAYLPNDFMHLVPGSWSRVQHAFPAMLLGLIASGCCFSS